MTVTRSSGSTGRGPADNVTGAAFIDPVRSPDEDSAEDYPAG